MQQENAGKLWYTRRDGVIRGPFSAAVISRYILLGRIRLNDELSYDQVSWQAAESLTGLLPNEIWRVSSWGDYQQLIVSRMQADERRQERRNKAAGVNNNSVQDRRSGKERRIEDSILSIAQFAFGMHKSSSPGEKRPRRLGMLVLSVVLAVLMLAWFVPAVR